MIEPVMMNDRSRKENSQISTIETAWVICLNGYHTSRTMRASVARKMTELATVVVNLDFLTRFLKARMPNLPPYRLTRMAMKTHWYRLIR